MSQESPASHVSDEESMSYLHTQIAELLKQRNMAFALLERAISPPYLLGSASKESYDDFIDKVQLLLWGPCDHDFGGKCPRCYPHDRK